MSMEVLVQVCIWGASNLPKTDLLSHTDPYIKMKMKYKGTYKETVMETTAKNNDPDPLWNSNENLIIKYNSQNNELPSFYFQLWDKNTFKDAKIGTAKLNLSQSDLQESKSLDIPFHFKNKKYSSCNSTVSVKFKEYVLTTNSMYGVLQDTIPKSLHSPELNRLYYPEATIMLHFNTKKHFYPCVDIHILYTTENPLYYVEITQKKGRSRMKGEITNLGATYNEGLPKIFQNISLENVKFYMANAADGVLFTAYKREAIDKTNVGLLLAEHGYTKDKTWEELRKNLSPVVNFIAGEHTEELQFPFLDEMFVTLTYHNHQKKIFSIMCESTNVELVYDIEWPERQLFYMHYEVIVQGEEDKTKEKREAMVVKDKERERGENEDRYWKGERVVRAQGLCGFAFVATLDQSFKQLECYKYRFTVEKQFYLHDLIPIRPF